MTAPVWLTSFAHQVATSANGAAAAAIWDASSTGGGTITVSTLINRRAGGCSLEINKTTSATSCYVYRAMPAAQTRWVVRLYIRITTMPSTQSRIFHLDASDTSDLYFFINSAGNAFEIAFPPSSVVTSSTTITTGTWYRIDMDYNVSGATWTCDWQIDGVAQTQLSYANGAAGTGAINLLFGNSSTGASTYRVQYTDFIASNTGADYPIGAGRGFALFPNGMGTHVNSTRFQDGDSSAIDASSYTLVDDWPPVATVANTDFIKQVTLDGAGVASYIEFTVGGTQSRRGKVNGAVGFLAYTSATTTANNGGCVVRCSDGTEITIKGSDATPVDYSDGSITNWFYAAAILTEPSGGWRLELLKALVFRCGYSTDVSPNPYWGALLIEYDISEQAEQAQVRQSMNRAASF